MKKWISILTLLIITNGYAQSLYTEINGNKQVFKVVNPDKKTSPYTGMTRKHWKDAATYLLEGAFSYIHTLDDAMKFPKQPGVSYPKNEGQVPTEKLEGLCRTLFIAVPLLKEDSNLVLNNMRVADYYRYQIGKLVDPESDAFIRHRARNGGPSQNLVEYGALAVSLFAVPEVLWHPLSQTQKDALAASMISYGDGPTVPSNWKFFNIFVLSFFKQQGYKVNETLLEEYLEKSLEHYRGNGWYNDNPAYDYYSMWAFQMYGVLWSEFFGKKHYPQYAARLLQNFKEVKDNYPYMFSRNGQMIMWGRSITYRIGSVIPFPLMGFVHDTNTNYGWMRRISSGVLSQFLQHPDMMEDRVPTLGYYGAFEPAVQSYSCRGSSYWMGKAFLGLLVPEDNPFWTATENEGAWQQELKKGQVYNKFQEESEILITDYPNIGAAEIRAWCNVPLENQWEKFRGSENYNRLAYNSAFLWQQDGANGEVAMNYVFKNKKGEWEPFRMYNFKGFEDGVYYRSAVLESDKNITFLLADIPLANGILRIDRNKSSAAIDVRLGHYALPVLKGKITTTQRKVAGNDVTIIDNGIYQLAMVTLKGWNSQQVVTTKGLHPEAAESSVINAVASIIPEATPVFATLQLWKKSGEKWTNSELNPIKQLQYNAAAETVELLFKNGRKKNIKY